MLGWSDFSLKYRGSVLGYLWSFLGPLMQFVIIFAVFRPFVGAHIPHYALYLFLGIIVWEHFALTTAGCIALPQEKAGLIQRTRVPRILLPMILGWTHAIIFLTRFAVFVMLAMVQGVRPTIVYAYLPLLLLHMTLLALGVGMALGAYSLRYRDIAHLWGIALQMLFWMTPVMYAVDRLPFSREVMTFFSAGIPWSPLDAIRAAIRVQPLTLLLHDARRVLLWGAMPSGQHIIFATILSGAIFLLGASIFRRRSRYFLQEY